MEKDTLQSLSLEMAEIQNEIDILSDFDMDIEHLEQAMESINARILKKVKSIDYVITGFDMKRDHLLLVAETLERNAKLAKKKAEQLDKNKDRVLQMLADTGFVTENTPLRTEMHTYYLRKVPGAVKISDETKIPTEYLKTKIEQVLDKALLRKHLMEGQEIEGASLEVTTKVIRK